MAIFELMIAAPVKGVPFVGAVFLCFWLKYGIGHLGQRNMFGSRVGKGFFFAMVSSCTFGMIPLFSLPAMQSGMSIASVLLYRFGIGGLALFALMSCQHESLRVSASELWRLVVLAVLNLASGVFLLDGLRYLPSGIASTVQFSYPVFTALIMMTFFGEKSSLKVWVAIALAVVGVALLSWGGCSGGENVWLGIAIELTAGLCYAVYLVAVPKLRLCGMNSCKLTFYVFLLSAVLVVCYAAPAGALAVPASADVWISLVMLGLVATAMSNYTLVLALRQIGSTATSVLGALEPLTAMLIGIAVFGDPLTLAVCVGFVLIVVAVLILVLKDKAGCEG